MNDDLVSRLRQNAEMLQGGPQRNLTKLWHSEVVKDAASHCNEAAARIEALEADNTRLRQEKSAGFSFWRSIAKRVSDARKTTLARAEKSEAESAELRATIERITRVDGDLAKQLRASIENNAALKARAEKAESVLSGAVEVLCQLDRTFFNIDFDPGAHDDSYGHVQVYVSAFRAFKEFATKHKVTEMRRRGL